MANITIDGATVDLDSLIAQLSAQGFSAAIKPAFDDGINTRFTSCGVRLVVQRPGPDNLPRIYLGRKESNFGDNYAYPNKRELARVISELQGVHDTMPAY